MSYIPYNANPAGRSTLDCTVRAIATFLGLDWDTVYARLSVYGFVKKDMTIMNSLWIGYLWSIGYRPREIPDTCPDCYTVKDFCLEHPRGKYLLATEGHVVAAIDGDYYDTWDSGNEVPFFYWERK